jgi:hypothetical protein
VWKLVARIHRASPSPDRTLGAFDAGRVERTLQDLDTAFGVSAGAANATDNAFLDRRIRAMP